MLHFGLDTGKAGYTYVYVCIGRRANRIEMDDMDLRVISGLLASHCVVLKVSSDRARIFGLETNFV